MELDGYVDRVRSEFAAVSEVAGDEVREVAERLVGPLESTLRLVLLEALSSAADEITLELAPGSVHVRLAGSDPEFVVTTVPTDAAVAPDVAPPAVPEGETGPTARINFRPPESLKSRIEEAAGRDGLSVNTWLTRAAAAALDTAPAPARPATGRNRAGWFG